MLPSKFKQVSITAQRKRTGGDRTDKIASTWATILARRDISQDLEMPYATVKTYVKLARRAFKDKSINLNCKYAFILHRGLLGQNTEDTIPTES